MMIDTVIFFKVGCNVSKFPALVRDAASRGHHIADHTWDHASLEGMPHEQFIDKVERTRQAIASHLLEHAYPGAIILMHDGGGDRSQTLGALRSVLPQLKDQNYILRIIFLP